PGGVPVQVLRGGAALQVAGGAGEEPQGVHAHRDLLLQHGGAGLAGLPALGVGELLGAVAQRVGDGEQGLLALRRGGLAPDAERAGGGRHRGVDLGGAADRGGAGALPGGGVDQVEGAAALGRDVLAGDERGQRRGRVGHGGGPHLVGGSDAGEVCGGQGAGTEPAGSRGAAPGGASGASLAGTRNGPSGPNTRRGSGKRVTASG